MEARRKRLLHLLWVDATIAVQIEELKGLLQVR